MECPNSALHCWMMCLSNNQTGKPHIYMHLCPGPFTPSSRFASATHLQFRPIETASNVPPHHKRRLLPPRAEPNDYDVGVEARVNARSFRIATAESQRSKTVKIREPERWPIAAAIHLSATSHTSPSPPLPLFLKAVCVYDGIMGVRNSYFSFMKTSATKFKAKRTNLVVATNTYFCLVSKPLTGVTGLKSQTFFLPTNTASSPLLAVADSFFWGASIG